MKNPFCHNKAEYCVMTRKVECFLHQKLLKHSNLFLHSRFLIMFFFLACCYLFCDAQVTEEGICDLRRMTRGQGAGQGAAAAIAGQLLDLAGSSASRSGASR